MAHSSRKADFGYLPRMRSLLVHLRRQSSYTEGAQMDLQHGEPVTGKRSSDLTNRLKGNPNNESRRGDGLSLLTPARAGRALWSQIPRSLWIYSADTASGRSRIDPCHVAGSCSSATRPPDQCPSLGRFRENSL